MKRRFRFAFIGAAAIATVIAAPFTIATATAQDFPILEELDLTDEQREEIQVIRQERRSDIEAILTDEQQTQFREAYQESQDFRTAAAAIENFTDDQKAEIRAVMRDSFEEVGAILTDEQREALRSQIQDRRQDRR
ncbi:MAG: Spy/CpxP family protein refolding chaperone [Cyanobacteria bacterium P01_C01_bin.120]